MEVSCLLTFAMHPRQSYCMISREREQTYSAGGEIIHLRKQKKLKLKIITMKTNSSIIRSSALALLLPAMLIFFSVRSFAQDAPKGKQKVTIHIQKDINGKKTEIDTTFDASADFDVDAWISDRDEFSSMPKHMEKMEREFKIDIPEMGEEGMPKTIIVNGDTIFLGENGENLNMFLKGMPGLGAMGGEGFFNQDAITEGHNCPVVPGMPECFHGDMKMVMPFLGMGMESLQQLIPFDNLEKVVVKKRKHGGKVVIKFKDDEDRAPRRKEHQKVIYLNDEMGQQPGSCKKVVIVKSDDNKNAKEINTEVQTTQDGDKQVIIIRKGENEGK